mmetsp:Transcript_25471/g.73515  ORF Transcript_25471/g.73515 Transcript_25471/m.73515 type:complete len:617 (+) Transcript_25471:101-1951(+)
MPHAADAHAVVGLHDAVVLHLLPVPEPDLAVDVAGHDPAAVRREAGRDGVACVEVTPELFLAHELEATKGLIADDLVVHGLAYEVLLLRVDDYARHGVHRGLCDVLDHHRDAKLPEEDLLVVRRRQQPLPFLAEGDTVHSAQVLVVLLNYRCRVRVPLHRFLVRAPCNDDVLHREVRVHGDTEGRLLVGEGRDDLARLGVPVLNILVVGHTVEAPAVARKVDVAHALVVAHVGAQALALVVVVPNLDLAVHAGGQDQVRGVREPSDLVHAHGVARPGVDPLLWQVALLVVDVLEGLRLVLYPGPPGVVGLLGAVENRGHALLRLALLALHRLLLLLLPGDLLLARPDLLLELPPDVGLVDEAAPLLGTGGVVPLLLLLGLGLRALGLVARDLVVALGLDRALGPARGLGLGLGLLRGPVALDAPPLGGPVPDRAADLRLGLGARDRLHAVGDRAARVRGVAVVVESQVLLVECKRAHAQLLHVPELVVAVLVLQVALADLDRPLQRLPEGREGRVGQDPLLGRVVSVVLHLVPAQEVNVGSGVDLRQQLAQHGWRAGARLGLGLVTRPALALPLSSLRARSWPPVRGDLPVLFIIVLREEVHLFHPSSPQLRGGRP